ncbi:protein C06A6.4, isoform a [Basidiobolus meristosporus CBS 931.73]|uniref:N-acyl-aliphatic-L-amino acid amidohydrolase n=1 Tax=Basidiobolus meristosporus CBS 931.73 TaxID=1314790 RepID=A0A1Y1YFQ0_9FUNG|nr:protein C06A6.4, isoform a [Basidiobolus meristosporus CBS 931.73]|eukprot:ORX96536.1 protein C06A6.4, isoform a [Basidiobolus meristosporus CBS 931.73]
MTLPQVQRLQEYLRVYAIHPNPDYTSSVEYVVSLAKDLKLQHKIVEVAPKNPLVIVTLPGTHPEEPSLALNSHMDVVPVYRENWTHDPFAADLVEDETHGEIIYARGAQDMKSIGIAHLEAIRELLSESIQLRNTIHVIFAPDEEVGGAKGWEQFSKTQEYRDLNIGLFLDEGLPNPDGTLRVFHGERAPWWVRFTFEGNTGHGLKFVENTAVEGLLNSTNTLLKFRAEQKQKLEASNGKLTLGQVSTVNLTMLKSGVQPNVVPGNVEAVFDIRVSPNDDPDEVMAMLKQTAKENNAKMEFITFFPKPIVTPIDSNPSWWQKLQSAFKKHNYDYVPDIMPGTTDARYVRQSGVPALGISPFLNTPGLLHDHDEFIPVKEYLFAIKFYKNLILELAN